MAATSSSIPFTLNSTGCYPITRNDVSNPHLCRRTSSHSSSNSRTSSGMRHFFSKSRRNQQRNGSDADEPNRGAEQGSLSFSLKSPFASSSSSNRHLSVNSAVAAASAPVSPATSSVPSPRHSTSSAPENARTMNPFTSGGAREPAPATRRPPPRNNDPPPAYSPPANPPSLGQVATATPVATTSDDRYAFLSHFDTIFLIDDSGSMAGRSWRETAAALRAITPICTAHDADGIDIIFLNHHPANPADHCNVKTQEAVEQIFTSVRPSGGTPTGVRLNHVLRPYLARYMANPEGTKPLNVIVITDGVPSDDVESVIISAAKKLDKADAPAWQVGVQFFQVGCEPGAAEALRELDDGLAEMGGGIRDIVDTVPWSGSTGEGLNAEGILKVVLGAVNRRLDRKRGSAELRRQ